MRDTDTPEMKASKMKIFELVKQWLGLSVEPTVEPTVVPTTSDM